MKRSFLVKIGVMFLVFLIVLLSGCQPQKEEPVTSQDAPKLWSVLKPFSEEEVTKQRKYIQTQPGGAFPVSGIQDGFVILTSGSDTLYEELVMEELLQLAKIAPVTLLIAGLAVIRSLPFYEVMDLPANSALVKMHLSDLMKLGFEQDYLNFVQYFQPVIWLLEEGVIQRQYLYYAVGQYEDVYSYFVTAEETPTPVQIGKPLRDLCLVRSETQEKEVLEITKPTLLIHWTIGIFTSQLTTLLDVLKDQIQVVVVLPTTDARTRYPIILQELAVRENADTKIEWYYRNLYEVQIDKALKEAENLRQNYPDLLIYEDQSYEMVRRFNLVPIIHPLLVEADDRDVGLYNFFLFDEHGVMIKEWICRMTLGNKEESLLMQNILEKAITELTR